MLEPELAPPAVEVLPGEEDEAEDMAVVDVGVGVVSTSRGGEAERTGLPAGGSGVEMREDEGLVIMITGIETGCSAVA